MRIDVAGVPWLQHVGWVPPAGIGVVKTLPGIKSEDAHDVQAGGG